MDRRLRGGQVTDGDTKLTVWLDRRRARAGDTATVVVDFVGRNTDWEVESISLNLSVHCFDANGDTETVELSHVEVVSAETVSAELRTTRTAELPVPAWSPYTVGGVGVVLTTEIHTHSGTSEERRHLSVTCNEIETAFEKVIEQGYVPCGSHLKAVPDTTPPYEQQFPLASPGSGATATPDTQLVCRPTPEGVEMSPPDQLRERS